jgi:hypothetical protein
MIDFGGGSPCGSLFLDEPGFPEGLGRALYTVEWGQSVVDRHPLTANGAGFKATTEQLMKLPRGTDIDVDGASRLYVSSWANGGFSYTDANVGYVPATDAEGVRRAHVSRSGEGERRTTAHAPEVLKRRVPAGDAARDP